MNRFQEISRDLVNRERQRRVVRPVVGKRPAGRKISPPVEDKGKPLQTRH